MGVLRRLGVPVLGVLGLGEMGSFQSAAAADWWDPNGDGLCIWAAYQPKSAASLAASYTDLSGNGNNAGVGVAPTWDAVNGWKFNGSTQYLTTTFLPQTDQTQTILIQTTNLSAAVDGYLFGAYTAALNAFAMRARHDLNRRQYLNGPLSNVLSEDLNGNFAIAGNKAYYNGADEGVTLGAWAGPSTQVLYIGCRNIGVPVDYFPYYCQALAIYDCTLTTPQVLAVATAMSLL